MPACELSTSIACARVVRGNRSSENAVRPAAASAGTRAASACGASSPTTTAPRFIVANASFGGGCTQTSTSAVASAAAAPSTMRAPA